MGRDYDYDRSFSAQRLQTIANGYMRDTGSAVDDVL